MSAINKNPLVPRQITENVQRLLVLNRDLKAGQALFKQGKINDAKRKFVALTENEPNYFAAWFALGLVAHNQKKWFDASVAFSRAAALNPKDIPTQLNLAHTYIEIEAFDLAEQLLKSVIEREPKRLSAFLALARTYHENKKYRLAVQTLGLALEIDAKSVEALHASASSLVEIGDLQLAGERYREALKLSLKDKRHTGKLPMIVSQILGLPESGDLKELERLIKKLRFDSKLHSAEIMDTLNFAEAKIREKNRDYAEAWPLYCEANRAVSKRLTSSSNSNYSRLESTLAYAKASDAFVDLDNSNKKSGGTSPIFIVGASRSGKSSLERLMGATKEIRKGYETKMVEHAIAQCALKVGLPKLTDFWYLPENVDHVFAEVFLYDLERLAEGSKAFTITYPGSIHHAGRIAKAIPEAKFVFMKRNRQDQALRCFQKHYRRGNTYSYQWKSCIEFLERYDEIMDFWSDRLGKKSIMLNYEDLVSDPKSSINQVGALLNLKMEDRTLPDIGDDRGCSTPYLQMISELKV